MFVNVLFNMHSAKHQRYHVVLIDTYNQNLISFFISSLRSRYADILESIILLPIFEFSWRSNDSAI